MHFFFGSNIGKYSFLKKLKTSLATRVKYAIFAAE